MSTQVAVLGGGVGGDAEGLDLERRGRPRAGVDAFRPLGGDGRGQGGAGFEVGHGRILQVAGPLTMDVMVGRVPWVQFIQELCQKGKWCPWRGSGRDAGSGTGNLPMAPGKIP